MMMKKIMPFTSLWTSALPQPGTRLSNACVENHFRQIKSGLISGKRKSHAEFVGERYSSIQNLLPRLVKKFYIISS